MAERQTKVTLIAQVNQYLDGMDKAAKKTRETGTEAEKLAAKDQAFEKLGRSALVMGAVIVAGLAVAIAKFAEFDQAMSQVQAVTQETAENMALLRDAALEAGGRTVYTATEAAHAIEELGKAGLSTADILGGALDGALDLAASDNLEVARAAEITATTLKQFGLAGEDAARVADILAAGAGKALGGVEDLAQGLKFVGPVAASMGVSLEETTAALAMFADQGLVGENAGTSLRGVLSSLTSPSKEAAEEIENLGINLYDAEGAFTGLENVAGQLAGAYRGLDDQTRDASLGIIFGNQQVTAARVLFQGGAEDIREYTEAVNDSGYAARVAADRLDNLSGDVEKLGGAFDTALIKSGSGANEILRSMVQSATFVVDAFSEIPEPVLNVGLAVGTVAGVMALVGGAALVAVPKVAAFRQALVNTSIGARGAAVSIGLVGAALSLALVAFGVFVARQAEMSGAAQEFAASLDQSTGAVTKYTRELVAKRLSESGAFDVATKVGVSQRELTDAVLAGGAAYEEYRAKIADAGFTLDAVAGIASSNATSAMGDLRTQLEDGKKQWEDTTAATEDNADSTMTASDAYMAAADEAATLNDELRSLLDTIMEANGLGQDAVSTNAAWRQSLEEAAEYVRQAQAGVEGFNLGLDASTAAGSANQDMLAQMAEKSQAAADAALLAGGSQEEYEAALNAGRQAIYDTALALSGNADEAQRLTDKIYAMPPQTAVDVLVNTYDAQSRLDAILRTIERINAAGLNPGDPSTRPTEYPSGYATGGYTPPVATFTMVGEKGVEFVSTAETVAVPANRAVLEYMHAGGDIRAFAAQYGVPAASAGGGGMSVIVRQPIEVVVMTDKYATHRAVTEVEMELRY